MLDLGGFMVYLAFPLGVCMRAFYPRHGNNKRNDSVGLEQMSHYQLDQQLNPYLKQY